MTTLKALVGLSVFLVPSLLWGATPPSGTVSEGNPLVTWTGELRPATGGGCGSATNPDCDNFQLSIVPPSAEFGSYVIEIRLVPVGDWDLEVYGPDGAFVDGTGNFPGQQEVVVLDNPPAGTYTVVAVPFAPAVGPDVDGDGTPDSYAGAAEVKHATPPAPGGGEPLSYAIHQPPSPIGRTGPEPSIGVNWKTGKVFFIALTDTLRITFDDCTSPAKDTWEEKNFATTSVFTGDPILFTDHDTGRTFVSQLLGIGLGTPAGVVPIFTKQSLMAYTDDDGDNWVPSQGSGINSGVDHQTVGGGRFAAPLTRDPNGPIYPNAVYYCSQDIVDALCARSDNGGLTFGPAVPIYNATVCNGLHGAVKVAPNDGTVYVPNKGCNGRQAVVVSENNGLTWDVREITGSTQSDLDGSVGIATDGTVYVMYGDGDGHPKVSVSKDKGLTWFNTTDVGADMVVGNQTGIRHTAFSVAVAGDPDRAAVAFLGSTEPTPGGLGDDRNWPGDWYLFVSHTYDGGATWTTINATPNDPVQRGTICGGGTGCGNGTRNLLDFNDSDIDREGRVLVAYADGCIGPCIEGRPNSFTSVSSVARQVNGRRMFSQFDAVQVPSAPLVSAAFDSCPTSNAVIISWPRPDDRGSAITAYNVYRRTASETNFSLLATVGGDTNTYTDTTYDTSQANFYQVTATNSAGEGQACGEASPECPDIPEPEDPCKLPGVTILTDGTGDFTTPVGMATFFGPAIDMQKLSMAEPGDLGAGKIAFVLKVVSLQNVPPDTTWPILFRAPNGTDYTARMHTNALSQVFFTLATGGNSANPTLNAGTPADPASGFSADGTIRVVLARSAIGDPAPGQDLTMFLVRIRSPNTATLTPDNMPDGLARTGTYTLLGSENCVCNPPDAVDDAADTVENNPVAINVVANDSDGGEPPLTVTAVTQPANGTAVNNGDGTVTYAPNSGFIGDDSFSYTIANDCGAEDTAAVAVVVLAREVCFEDDASQIAYTDGWHSVADADASDGHYRMHTGRSPDHNMSFTFTLESSTGALTYTFGRSPKSETADVYIDGHFIETVNYQGPNGSQTDLEFGCAECSRYYQLVGGTHTFELRNLKHRISVDRLCVTKGGSDSQPSSGPGATSSSSSTTAGGSNSTLPVALGADALSISVAAETDSPLPMQLVLIDPAGAVLQSVSSSGGLAVIDRPVSGAGVYVVQVANLGLGPMQVWTAATPRVQR